MENINSFASLKNICCKRSASFFLSFLILLLFLLSLNCNHSTPPNNDNTSVTITAEDASCIEAWLNVKLNSITLPQQFNLFENDSLKTNLILLSNDTTIFVEGLLPKKNYRYKLTYTKNGGDIKSSNEITVETMDTTSHNFTWQTFTFGQHSSSTLYDVAIIDENNIWAVGEIYMNDSLGNPDPHAYNAVHWDGSVWEVKRIYTYSSCNAVDYAPLKAICTFSDTNIVITSGGSIGWFNGKVNKPDCSIRPLLTGSINKMWGSSSNDLYAVGNGGNIAHWDGVKWRKIEIPEGTSGTDVDLYDIWGSPDGSIVWACGYYDNKPGTYLLRLKSGSFEIAYDGTANEIRILNDTISGAMVSIFTSSPKRILVGTTTGVYSALSTTNGKGKRLSFTASFFPGLPFRLRGTGLNDFTIVGEKSFIGHYNGYSWRYYHELWTDNTRLRSVAQMNNISVAVGSRYISPIYSPAVIYVGRR